MSLKKLSTTYRLIILLVFALGAALGFYSCSESSGQGGLSRLFMVGTADPAASGSPLVMEQITFGEILSQGGTGIATFEAGEGEAIGLDGDWWVVDENGDVSLIVSNERDATAAVVCDDKNTTKEEQTRLRDRSTSNRMQVNYKLCPSGSC